MAKKKKKRVSVNKKDATNSRSNLKMNNTKKYFFWLFMMLVPLVFFALIEIILRLTNYGGDTRLFVETLDKEQKIYLNINPDVARRYFTYNDFVPSPRVNLFLKNKPEGSYRIFVMGGSTAAGYPYGNNLDFGRILHRKLADTFPNQKN